MSAFCCRTQVGLDRPIEYPVHEGKLDVYANMKWLQVKAEKKHYQIYMEARLKMYQERCAAMDAAAPSVVVVVLLYI